MDLNVLSQAPVPLAKEQTMMWAWDLAAVLGCRDLSRPFHVLELCSGTGAISLMLAKEGNPTVVRTTDINLKVLAVDVLPEACTVARKNAERNGIPAEEVQVKQADIFDEGVAAKLLAYHRQSLSTAERKAFKGFDLIIMDPPNHSRNTYNTLKRQTRRYNSPLAMIGEAPLGRLNYDGVDETGGDFYKLLNLLAPLLLRAPPPKYPKMSGTSPKKLAKLPQIVMGVQSWQGTVIVGLFEGRWSREDEDIAHPEYPKRAWTANYKTNAYARSGGTVWVYDE